MNIKEGKIERKDKKLKAENNTDTFSSEQYTLHTKYSYFYL